MNETLAQILAVALIGLAVFSSDADSAEIKPFVSGSIINVNATDWKTPNYYAMRYESPKQMATLKAGVVIRENGLSVDINLFHISDPTNGRVGHLNEGDYGANGFEITARKEF